MRGSSVRLLGRMWVSRERSGAGWVGLLRQHAAALHGIAAGGTAAHMWAGCMRNSGGVFRDACSVFENGALDGVGGFGRQWGRCGGGVGACSGLFRVQHVHCSA